MKHRKETNHYWVWVADRAPDDIKMPHGQEIVKYDRCVACRHIRVTYNTSKPGVIGRSYFSAEGKYFNKVCPPCRPVKYQPPPPEAVIAPEYGALLSMKGPQMPVKYGTLPLIERLFTKHKIHGSVDLKRELAAQNLVIWEQAQNEIIKKVKQEFQEDGISLLLEPTPFKFSKQEIIDHGETYTDVKGYTPAAPGDDFTLQPPRSQSKYARRTGTD